MVLTPSKELDPEYLQIFLSSPATVHALEGESVGSTMVNLNQRILLDLEIFFPPLPEQQEIVRRVEDLFAFADRIEVRLATAQKTVERLTPATLAKAFRGELVPQDPNDEPAAALLERIKTAAKATPKPTAITRGATEGGPRKKTIKKEKSMDDPKTQILKMPGETIAFDDLREVVQIPYEELQQAVFELLAENPPRLTQAFDKDTKCMKLRINNP